MEGKEDPRKAQHSWERVEGGRSQNLAPPGRVMNPFPDSLFEGFWFIWPGGVSKYIDCAANVLFLGFSPRQPLGRETEIPPTAAPSPTQVRTAEYRLWGEGVGKRGIWGLWQEANLGAM